MICLVLLEWKLERERWKVQGKEKGRDSEPGEALALGRITGEGEALERGRRGHS